MSTRSATVPVRARSSVERLARHRLAPWAALAALCAAAAAVALRAGRGLTFFGDEWDLVLRRQDFSLEAFLTPHGQHPVVPAVALYKALENVFGIESYTPYQVALIAVHVLTAVLLYLYARRRVGPWLALVPAALLLFLGAAWEDMVWAFQVTIVGSVTAGLAMLLALDAGRLKLAALALTLSVTSSGLGLPFLALAAVEIVLDPRLRLRAWYVLAVPLATLAVIFLGFYDPTEVPRSSPSHAIRFAIDMGAAGFGAFGGLGLGWGRPLAVAALAGLVYVARRDGGLSPRAIALLCGAAVYWLITGSGRADFGVNPDSGRYLYLSAVLLLALAVTVPRRPVVGLWGGAVLAGVVALLCVSGAGLFKEGAASRLGNTDSLLPRLTALDVARDHVAPGLQPDVLINPDLMAGDYFRARDRFGSPALSVAELRAQPDGRRQFFDVSLAHALALKLAPGGEVVANAPAPQVEAVTGGRTRTDDSCTVFRPDGPGAAVELTLDRASYRLRAEAGGPVPVQLRRLADTYTDATLELAGGATATLALPRDQLVTPWHLRLVSAQPVRVCPAA